MYSYFLIYAPLEPGGGAISYTNSPYYNSCYLYHFNNDCVYLFDARRVRRQPPVQSESISCLSA